MKTKRILTALLAAALALLTPVGYAVFDPVNDDTDIFLANPNFTATRPNILIIVDNTANWNTPFTAEKSALVNAFNSLNDGYNVGLMMFTETGGTYDSALGTGNSGSDGAYVRYAVRQMTSANKTVLNSIISGLDSNNDKSNNGKASQAMREAYHYFAGQTAYAGSQKAKTDYGGHPTHPARALSGNHAFATGTDFTYRTPITDGCQKNFIIYISNGKAQDNQSDLDNSEAALRLANNNVAPSTITLSNTSPENSSQQGNWADEWARYMANADCNATFAGRQSVITYVLDVGPSVTVDSSVQGAGWSTLLKSMAVNGKGKYFAINNNQASTASAIESALKTIFSEVQAVNSVFASTTLPVSVNVRGTNLNQVYIGVFRPDDAKQPRWLGNLKAYKLAADAATQTVYLSDALNARAENSSTGFISSAATSYWTANSCFWSYLGADPNDTTTAVPATCDSTANSYPYWSDKPDGDKVEKGGAAQRLREVHPLNQGARNVYTCTSAAAGGICASGDSLSATPFSAGGTGYPADNTHITASELGAVTTYSVSSLSGLATVATGILSSRPSPAWSDGNTVVITGATPTDFNGTYVVRDVVENGDGTLTFKYDLAASLLSNRALVTTASAHLVNTGDTLDVSSASPSDYQVTGAAVTRQDSTSFTYDLGSNAPRSLDNPASVVMKAKKVITAISGSGTTAFVTIPGHGMTGTVSMAITGSNVSAFNITGVTSSTYVDDDTYRITTSTSIVGSASQNAILVTTVGAHELKVGDTVTITGLTQTPIGSTGSYNCTCTVLTVPSTTQFTYKPAIIPSGTATGTPNIIATRTFSLGNSGSGSGSTSGLTNGTTQGGNRDRITGRTPTALNLTATNWTVQVTGTTSDIGFNTCNTTPVSSCLSTTFFAFTIPSTNTLSGFQYSVPSNQAPAGSGTSASGSISAVFKRTAITSATFSQVVAELYADNTNMRGVLTIRPASVTVQSIAIGTITAARTTDTNAAARLALMNWVRGADNATAGEKIASPATTNTTVRPSIHGDVLHSRPAVVNYNRYSSDNDIYVYYGGNDGMLHAVKAGFGSDEVGINPGDERWSFIPREFFPYFKRMRDQKSLISSSSPRNYTADGPISVYQFDANNDGRIRAADGDKVYLYFAVRRGGRFIYALDVSDPATPKLLWRKNSSDTGWGELGQTWSEPKVAKLRINTAGVATDTTVLIFGAGYDANVDDVNPCLVSNVLADSITVKAIGTGSVEYTAAGSCVVNNATGGTSTRTRSMGRGVMVVNATTGAVIWQAGRAPSGATTNLTVSAMSCSIPSDITLVDIDRDGRVERGYVGDTCGNVWRMDISNANPASWTVNRIATTSSATTTDITNQRRFLFSPDVVFSSDATGSYAAVLIGSGDREHPFDTTVTNRFYMIKDRTDSATSLFTSLAACAGVVGNPVTDANLYDATNDPGNNSCGFKLTFNAGEKNVGSAVTLSSTTFFNTNQPSSTAGGGSCSSNLGVARQYQINFETTAATSDLNALGGISSSSQAIANRSVIHSGGGFLPSPVPAIVQLDGKKYEVVISGTEVGQPAGSILDARLRTYWYKELD